MEPRKYAIAICGIGGLGLITSPKPELIDFGKDFGAKDERLCWTGIYLSDGKRKAGSFWCSSKPDVIGYLDDIVDRDLLL